MSPLKQSFLLALQTRQEHTSMMRLSASTLAPVMAELRGTGAASGDCHYHYYYYYVIIIITQSYL